MLSRIAKLPLTIPTGVEVTINGADVKVKGALGQLESKFNDTVEVVKDSTTITLKTKADTKFAKALSGTVHA